MTTGYLHPAYAASFSEWGVPRLLERSGAWVLERRVPGSEDRDAMGLYPLFCCRDWCGLAADLEACGRDWVALSLVSDPMADPGRPGWMEAFDRVVPFREHHVVETGDPGWSALVNPRHRKHARRALGEMRVRVVEDPSGWVREWEALHAVLAERHGIRGMRRFSPAAFAQQLAVPGMVMFAAEGADGALLGLDLWYLQGDCAQGHLAAFSPDGYRLRASYATKWFLLEHFASLGVRWVNLGGAAEPGLKAFKEGWTRFTRTAHLCSRVFRPDRYAALVAAAGTGGTDYVPAYRAGEFSGEARAEP